MKMNKQNLTLLGIGALITCAIVYASNNVDFVEDYLG